MWQLLAAAAGLICLLFFGVMLYDSNRFVRVDYGLTDSRIKKKTRLVLLTDLHNKQYGTENEKLLRAIREAAPDLIVCAGDLMTSVPDKSMEPACRLIRALAAEYPFYYANGNHEWRIYQLPGKFGRMGERYRSCLEQAGVCLLEDDSVVLSSRGICLYGLDLPELYYRKFKEAPLSVKELEGRLGKPRLDCCNILLAHNPVYFDVYREWGAQLTLAGHVHGGVMRLPWLGGVLSTAFTLFPKYDGGLFDKEGRRMIVSRGLGSHTIPVRLFNPAELVVIDLDKE